jgi:hypothetical protein
MRKLIIILLLLVSSTVLAQEKKQATSCDSVQYYKHKSDSLSVQLFLANYKVEKVKFYLNLVQKKPSQAKFLKGWIIRAVK